MRASLAPFICVLVLLQHSNAFPTLRPQRSLSTNIRWIDNSPADFVRTFQAVQEAADDGDSDSSPNMSKAKWKKKRYLMMQDVIGFIDKRDARAPRKAHEIVSRMYKLSEIHQDDTMKPDAQVYNVRDPFERVRTNPE